MCQEEYFPVSLSTRVLGRPTGPQLAPSTTRRLPPSSSSHANSSSKPLSATVHSPHSLTCQLPASLCKQWIWSVRTKSLLPSVAREFCRARKQVKKGGLEAKVCAAATKPPGKCRAIPGQYAATLTIRPRKHGQSRWRLTMTGRADPPED